MNDIYHEVDGYKIRLQRRDDLLTKYHAEAKDDVWARYHESFASDATDCLSKLAAKTGLDREELLIVFGYEP